MAFPAPSNGQSNLQTPMWGSSRQPDDQYRNPNINNRDHLVGQLTTSYPTPRKPFSSNLTPKIPFPSKPIQDGFLFWPTWPLWVALSHFKRLWIIWASQDHFGPLWLLWTILQARSLWGMGPQTSGFLIYREMVQISQHPVFSVQQLEIDVCHKAKVTV